MGLKCYEEGFGVNILLINANNGFRPSTQTAPLGLMSIGTYLKERGYHVRVYDRNVDKIPLKKLLLDFRPDAAGVSVTTMRHLEDGIALSRQLRNMGLPVIWGGHMATIASDLVLLEGSADYVVVGEGEITFYELLQTIEQKRDLAQVKGIVYQAEGAICCTPEREFADLADFPEIDWSLVDPQKHFSPHICCSKMMMLYGAKGCPGQCAFCSNKSFHHCTYRKRPNEYVISEIEELATKYGMDGFEFTDEMFGLHKAELYDFCDRLRALNLNLVWGCQTRLGHLTREDLQYMYDSGFRWIFYGVESGSPEMLKRIHKGINLKTIERDYQYCKEIGIYALSGFIIGYPDETEEQLRDSVRLMLRLNTNSYNVMMFFPVPGSELYDYLVENGRLTPLQTLAKGSGPLPTMDMETNYSNVPMRDLHVVQSFFHWRTFWRKNIAKGSSRYAIALKTVGESLRQIMKQGFFNMIRYAFSSAKYFLSTAWHAYAYPSIRKKYGLYVKKKTMPQRRRMNDKAHYCLVKSERKAEPDEESGENKQCIRSFQERGLRQTGTTGPVFHWVADCLLYCRCDPRENIHGVDSLGCLPVFSVAGSSYLLVHVRRVTIFSAY